MPHSDVSSAPAPTITEGVSGGGVSPAAVLIRGARVIDGTGAPEYPADLWIRDGRIAAIAAAGELAVPAGARELDATGLVVAPGFIDVHSHADNAPVLTDDDLTKLAQGVTTEVTGNCGYSLAPVAPPPVRRRFSPIASGCFRSRTRGGAVPPSGSRRSTGAAPW